MPRPPQPIRVFHYRPRGRPEEVNFGDSVSPMIVAALTGRPTVWAEVEGADLVGIGSVLQRVTARRWYRPLRLRLDPVAVWGAGFVRPGPPASLRLVAPLALRGPRSLARLPGAGPLPFGDPGILLAGLFRPRPDRRSAWGIVPHKTDMDHPALARLAAATPGARIIRLDAPPLETLAAIAGCDHVVSSSLHGLVAADSLAIPNWRIRLGDRLTGGDHKFLDYAEGIGRPDIAAVPLPADGALDRASAHWPADFAFQRGLPAQGERLARALTDRFA